MQANQPHEFQTTEGAATPVQTEAETANAGEASLPQEATKAEPAAVQGALMFAEDERRDADGEGAEAQAQRAEPAEPQEASTPAEAEPKQEAAPPGIDRRRLEEQLEALKRRESELRRALAIADHPELAEAIRELEGRAYAISRVEAKLAQGLTKAEERRREAVDKKLSVLREKRAELDSQIAELEKELAALGVERTRAFEAERREALQNLLVTLSTHKAALEAAGLEAVALVPELGAYLPEVYTLAEELSAKHKAAQSSP